MIRLLNALCCLLLLTACDPMRRIEMKNKSTGNAVIVWTLKEDSARLSPLFISNAAEVTFELKNKKPHNRANLSCGLGAWTGAEIDDLSDDLESLEIKSPTARQKFVSTQDIKNFLLQQRHGLGKSKISIVIQ